MKNQRLSIAAVLCLFALPVAANANALAFGGSGGAIPDNVASGVNFNAIVAPGAGSVTSLDSITVSMVHSFVGDLTFTLTHVDTGTSVIFVQRTARTDGGGGSIPRYRCVIRAGRAKCGNWGKFWGIDRPDTAGISRTATAVASGRGCCWGGSGF